MSFQSLLKGPLRNIYHGNILFEIYLHINLKPVTDEIWCYENVTRPPLTRLLSLFGKIPEMCGISLRKMAME